MGRLSDAQRAMDANSIRQPDGLMLKGFPALYFTLGFIDNALASLGFTARSAEEVSLSR